MKLVLENQIEFKGLNFGSEKEVIGRVVFNNDMIGYEEVIANPVYKDLIVVMNYPLIGNYGFVDEDYDYKNIHLKGLIVGNYNAEPSNFRQTETLSDVMEENNITGLSNLDTRKLVKIIRDNGSLKGIITSDDVTLEAALEKLNNYEEVKDLVSKVSTKKVRYSKTANPKYTVLVLDCGVKTSFLKALKPLGYNLIMVPYNYDLREMKALKPDGLIISNGPGELNQEVLERFNYFKGKLPILGISYGANIIAKAYDSEIIKLPYGMFEANSPIKNLKTKKVMSVETNNKYLIKTLSKDLKPTHNFLSNNLIAGFYNEKDLVAGLYYEPLSGDLLDRNEDVFLKFSQKMEEVSCQKEKI